MSNGDYEKLVGRVSALEMLLIVNEIKALKGASSVEITEAAKRRAEFWKQIGDALEDDAPDVVSVARTAQLEKLGKLLVLMAKPISEEIEQMIRNGNNQHE